MFLLLVAMMGVQQLESASDSDLCAVANSISARENARLPLYRDSGEVQPIQVSCERRQWAMRATSYYPAPAHSRGRAWIRNHEAVLNRTVCQDRTFALMVQRGWRFTQTTTFEGGETRSVQARC